MQSNQQTHVALSASRGVIFVLTAALLWGTGGVVKQTIAELAPTNALSIAFFRMGFSVPVLGLVCALALRGAMLRIARRDLAITLFIGGLTGVYQAMYFGAISEVGVSIATLIALCVAPIVVAIESVVFMKERLTARVLVAMGCAIGGIVLLTGFQTHVPGNTLSGMALAAGSATAYGTVTVISRALSRQSHPLQTATFGFSFGALILFGLANISTTGLVVSYPPMGWVWLLYLGVMPTALAYALFLSGMRSTPATVASIFTLAEPLMAAVLAWIIFGERLNRLGFVGAGLLLVAMLALVVKHPPRRSIRTADNSVENTIKEVSQLR